jgi:hypothetical protein
MGPPAKVMLEVTATEYTWCVLDAKDTVIAEQSMRRVPGGAKGTKKAALFAKAVDDQDLLDAIENADPYDIMKHLEAIR